MIVENMGLKGEPYEEDVFEIIILLTTDSMTRVASGIAAASGEVGGEVSGEDSTQAVRIN